MDNKRFLSLLVAVLMAVAVQAQNSIDRMVERYGSVGNFTFTTAVQRNPQTRKVEKVVKKLEVSHQPGVRKFVEAFRAEAKRHSNATTRRRDGSVTTILTAEGATSNRIYMLKHDDGTPPSTATVTIIIRMKDGK